MERTYFIKQMLRLAAELNESAEFNSAMIVNDIHLLVAKYDKEIYSDLKKELDVTDSLLQERQKVLDAIPECKVHGVCIPHALDWIEKMKLIEEEISRLAGLPKDSFGEKKSLIKGR